MCLALSQPKNILPKIAIKLPNMTKNMLPENDYVTKSSHGVSALGMGEKTAKVRGNTRREKPSPPGTEPVVSLSWKRKG